MHILPCILRSKDSQTMKLCQLIDYNMKSIFLQKSYTKYGAEASPRPFSEKWKLSISLDQLPKVSDSLFLLYAKLRAIKIYWNQAACHMHLPHMKLLKKQKEVLVSLPYFLHNFWRKIFLLVCSIKWPSFIV